jgi:hypothetical protein
VLRADIEGFLAALPLSAFLEPTTTRGVIVLTLLRSDGFRSGGAAR